MTRLRLLLAATLVALLCACAGPGLRAPEPAVVEAVQAARAAETRGEVEAAVTAWLRAATLDVPVRAGEYRMRAAELLAQSGQPERARGLLAAAPAEPAPGEAAWRRVAGARLALLEGRAEEALGLVGPDLAAAATGDLAVAARGVRAEAFAAAGRPLEGAAERVELELFLLDPERVRANRRALWESLVRLPPEVLEQARRPPPDSLGGWVELAYIASTSLYDPAVFEGALAQWRTRYPGHPATLELVPELIGFSEAAARPPRAIALLLPFGGPFRGAGEAVRDGFLAAWLADADPASRPRIIVRDTTEGDVVSLHAEVVAAGAEFVVGPLQRAEVTALAAAGIPAVPTLVLNHPGAVADSADGSVSVAAAVATAPAGPGGAVPGTGALYRFALAPEDEARRVAERAWLDGRTRAAALAPQGEWGDRVAGAFVAGYEHLGGVVVEVVRYDGDAKDMTEPVVALLNIAESETRYQALRQVLPRIEFDPRPRGDVDFAFVAAFPRQARQIVPQFRFHRAESLPLYATSHVFTGRPEPGSDIDLDGVQFGDAPWALDPPGDGDALRDAVAAALPSAPAGFVRLHAFGADAYRLVPWLPRLRSQPSTEYQGATGRLSVGPDGQIQRRMTWARFENGVPRVLEAGTASR